jgi:hypothetical protein
MRPDDIWYIMLVVERLGLPESGQEKATVVKDQEFRA